MQRDVNSDGAVLAPRDAAELLHRGRVAYRREGDRLRPSESPSDDPAAPLLCPTV
jgi:hypothetical protein